MFMALGSAIQLSRHSPQPVQRVSSITGLHISSVNAPGTGQRPMHAPHSGPLKGRQFCSSIVALASFGSSTLLTAAVFIAAVFIAAVFVASVFTSDEFVSLSFSSASEINSEVDSGFIKALSVHAVTQGQSSHK